MRLLPKQVSWIRALAAGALLVVATTVMSGPAGASPVSEGPKSAGSSIPSVMASREPSAATKKRFREAELPPGYEITRLRTATTRTFLSEDGRETQLVREGSRFFEDAEGQPRRKDNTLVPTSGRPGYHNRANEYVADLPAEASGPVRFTVGDAWVEFRLLGASGRGVIKSDTQRFADALPGVNLTYTAEDAQLKEDLTLAGPDVATTFTYEVSSSTGISPVQTATGGIDFVDGTGLRQFAFAPPFMYDSSETAEGFSRDVSLTLGADAGRTILTLSADRNWLTSPRRKFPVVIDPTIYRNNGTTWNPNTGVMSFGNVTNEGQCCYIGVFDHPEWREYSNACDPNLHPEDRDFERMPIDGLEYSRMAIYPCAYPDWRGHYDEVFRRAALKGVQFLPQISQGLNCADGTRLSPAGNPPDNSSEWSDLYNVGVDLARRYGPIDAQTGAGLFWRNQGCNAFNEYCSTGIKYLPVRAWQIWNEPNLPSSWGNGPAINPGGYREALFRARAGLRNQDPNARIIAAGLGAQPDEATGALINGQATPMGAKPFLQQLMSQDGFKAFDAVGMHFYQQDENRLGVSLLAFLKTKYRDTLDAYGGGVVDIWIDEFGAPSAGSGRTEATQQQWVNSAVSQVLTNDMRSQYQIGPMMHYKWMDDPGTGYFSSTGLWKCSLAGCGVPPNGGVVYNGFTHRKPAGDTMTNYGRTHNVVPLPSVRWPGYRPSG